MGGRLEPGRVAGEFTAASCPDRRYGGGLAGAVFARDAGPGAGLHGAARRPQRLDRANHGWGADVGGG